MIDYTNLIDELQNSSLRKFSIDLKGNIDHGLSSSRHGDLPMWLDALSQLPQIKAHGYDLLNEVKIGARNECTEEQISVIETQFKKLIPWRKGPFTLFDLFIDSEWRSDWKWQRICKHISPLKDRNILDIGCGNGYYCLRMMGQEAKRVIGVDPSARFIVQFYMLKHFIPNALPVDILPLGIEQITKKTECFDTTFSMGVFYHRRSPIDHLTELKDTLRPGGELILETLIIDGKLGEVLVPEGRYAMMRNVWFLPSQLSLESWLKKCGYKNIRCVDQGDTTIEEQRSTSWMPSHSLSNFLNPENPKQTAEGHPAPKRAVFIAQK